jgi:hypothetical protein
MQAIKFAALGFAAEPLGAAVSEPDATGAGALDDVVVLGAAAHPLKPKARAAAATGRANKDFFT